MIVVGGEALVDLVPQDADPLSPLVPRLGGGPFNVAVALGRLGADVSFLSRVSLDGYGDALLDRLSTSNVDTSLVQRGPEPTTLAVATVGADGSARYVFHAHASADRFVHDPGPLPDHTTALSLGTLSLVLEPGASVYEQVMRREDVPVALDPNIRADLIEDADAYRARFQSWLPDVTLLKMSEEDAEWLGGDWEGPAAVVITRGGDGISVTTRTGINVTVPSVPVEVVDTIGAGDTTQAALLRWLDKRDLLRDLDTLDADGWRQALSFAARAAAITCSRPGADPPTEREVLG